MWENTYCDITGKFRHNCVALKVTKRTIDEYRKLLTKLGDEEFYKFIIVSALGKKRIDYEFEEVYLLDMAEAFSTAYKTSADDDMDKISRLFRKAGQKMYTEKSKLNKDYPIIKRFLNVVK